MTTLTNAAMALLGELYFNSTRRVEREEWRVMELLDTHSTRIHTPSSSTSPPTTSTKVTIAMEGRMMNLGKKLSCRLSIFATA